MIINGDDECGRQHPTGGLTVQVSRPLGLRVGGHLALNLRSSTEPGEQRNCRNGRVTVTAP